MVTNEEVMQQCSEAIVNLEQLYTILLNINIYKLKHISPHVWEDDIKKHISKALENIREQLLRLYKTYWENSENICVDHSIYESVLPLKPYSEFTTKGDNDEG